MLVTWMAKKRDSSSQISIPKKLAKLILSLEISFLCDRGEKNSRKNLGHSRIPLEESLEFFLENFLLD